MPTNLNPSSTQSAIILSATGSAANVAAAVPFQIYTASLDFLSGAALQVNYVYKKLGGDVVDIELTPSNVYAAYEEAVLEYSYIFNLHHGKNVLSSVLGDTTGTFDHKGDRKSGPTSSNLKYPRCQFTYAKTVGEGMSSAGSMGGSIREYSASFNPVDNVQDYDLQSILSSSSATGVNEDGETVPYSGKVGDNRVYVTKVFFRSPRAMWRFYGYYGGIGVVGNGSTYGQFADDSTFEVVPTWQNKMQAIMYEDSISTRTSNYSYELVNNRLRLYPNPSDWSFQDAQKVWFKFYIKTDATAEDDNYRTGVNGINNINTMPLDNIPYANINAIGKQWIRKYALALCKEMLGQIRGKFTTLPIPGESVTLNHSELLSQAKEEQQQLRDKLTEILKEMEYPELAKKDAETTEAAAKTLQQSPLPIFVG
jgi:hypothetical protein